MAHKPRVNAFPILNPQAAGIDVHADWHWVAVPPGSVPPTRGGPGGPDELPAEVRKFGTCTDDLEAIADWLTACGVTTVAMESTGVYWIPLFELLERRAFTVLLVDPRQTRRMLNQCDRQVESCLKTFADKTGGVPLAAKPRRHGKQGHDPRFDARNLLYRLSGADLTMIEGIGENTALVILSEIGPDVSRFPTVKNFTSWLGLCPQHRESNGKIKSRHVRRGASRAGKAFRLAGQGCQNAKHALGAFYRRIRARCGGPKAVLATARKIAERVYRLLKHGQEYERRDAAAYEAAYRQKVVKGLARRAAEFGYRLEAVESSSS